MAKSKKPSERAKDLEALVVSTTAENANLNRQLAARNERASELTKRLEAFGQKYAAAGSKGRKLAVDFGGGAIAQVSTELINWGVRALGEWSKDGWIATNVDILQGLPHFFAGLGIYIAEVATRKGKDKVLVSASREVISEASKLFAQLGFSNLTRAIRMRMVDANMTADQLAGLQADNQALRAQLAAAKK